jgi:hypothetical protein
MLYSSVRPIAVHSRLGNHVTSAEGDEKVISWILMGFGTVIALLGRKSTVVEKSRQCLADNARL